MISQERFILAVASRLVSLSSLVSSKKKKKKKRKQPQKQTYIQHPLHIAVHTAHTAGAEPARKAKHSRTCFFFFFSSGGLVICAQDRPDYSPPTSLPPPPVLSEVVRVLLIVHPGPLFDVFAYR